MGGSSWPLSHLGLPAGTVVYPGMLALGVNLAVAVLGTVLFRWMGVPAGADLTVPSDYTVDEGDEGIQRMAQLVDGAAGHRPAHLR